MLTIENYNHADLNGAFDRTGASAFPKTKTKTKTKTTTTNKTNKIMIKTSGQTYGVRSIMLI